jgi:hypothetical protein
MATTEDLIGAGLFRRASGAAPGDGRVFTVDDVEALRQLTAVELFSPDELLHFVRVLGSSLGRVADAAVSLFVDDVERPLLDAGGDRVAIARNAVDAVGMLAAVSRLMDALLRLHLEQAVDQSRSSRAHGGVRGRPGGPR